MGRKDRGVNENPQPDCAATPSPDRTLDVGVIYTHERQFIEPLLASLATSAPGLELRLILVDNCSREGTGEWEGIVPQTVVLKNDRRLPYAPNLNRILAAATARYVLLLNTDMLFEPGEACLTKMFEFMESQPDCGMSICRIYHPTGSYAFPARRFQTLGIIAGRRLGLARLFRGSLAAYFYRERSEYSTFDCDWVSGCFMLARREALQQVGNFDPNFGKYFEDVDICQRLHAAGWRVMFHGGSYCFHYEQRASMRLFSWDAWRHAKAFAWWLGKRWRQGTSKPSEPPRTGSEITFAPAAESKGPAFGPPSPRRCT